MEYRHHPPSGQENDADTASPAWLVRWALASVQADARVKHGIDKVHDQVRDDDEGRGQDHDSHDDGQVLLVDRLNDGPAKSGYAEERLGDDDSAERGADVEARQGNHRRERGTQRVPRDHATFTHALGPGGPDVVLTQYIQHRR